MILYLILSMFLHYLVKLENYNGILHVMLQCSFCMIWGCLISSYLNQMTTKPEIQCSSAQKKIRDVSELKQW